MCELNLPTNRSAFVSSWTTDTRSFSWRNYPSVASSEIKVYTKTWPIYTQNIDLFPGHSDLASGRVMAAAVTLWAPKWVYADEIHMLSDNYEAVR